MPITPSCYLLSEVWNSITYILPCFINLPSFLFLPWYCFSVLHLALSILSVVLCVGLFFLESLVRFLLLLLVMELIWLHLVFILIFDLIMVLLFSGICLISINISINSLSYCNSSSSHAKECSACKTLHTLKFTCLCRSTMLCERESESRRSCFESVRGCFERIHKECRKVELWSQEIQRKKQTRNGSRPKAARGSYRVFVTKTSWSGHSPQAKPKPDFARWKRRRRGSSERWRRVRWRRGERWLWPKWYAPWWRDISTAALA